MMPFGSECCKCSKLHVDLFLESYTRRTTHNGILKNCTVANIACTKSFHDRASCLLVPATRFKWIETITSTYTLNNVLAHVQQLMYNTTPKNN